MKLTNICLILSVLFLVILSVIFHYFLLKIEWKDLIMIDAVFIGPIAAVLITRMLDEERFSKDRRLEIFRILMKERGLFIKGISLPYDFIGAFNLIPVEFYKEKTILQAWKEVYESMCCSDPSSSDQNGWQVLIESRQQKISVLLYEMAKSLKMSISPFAIQASYTPKGWNLQKENIQLINDILNNRRGVNVNITSTPSQ